MKKDKLIKTGAKTVIAGGTTALGTVLGGPLGAVAGGVIGAGMCTVLSDGIDDFLDRQLSKQEQKRVKSVYELTKAKIQENIEIGKTLRSDVKPEQLEETFLIAKSTTDERKLILMANLYANTLFDESISNEHISYLIKTANQLQYQELCQLSLFARKNNYPLKDSNYHDYQGITLKRDFLLILHQVYSLMNQDLLECEGIAILGITDFNPHKTRLTITGKLLFHYMELNTISDTEIKNLQTIINYSILEAKSE